jgi:hypothetical protein
VAGVGELRSAPEKADELYKAVQQEMDSLRRVPPTAAEVERVKEQQRPELEVAKKQERLVGLRAARPPGERRGPDDGVQPGRADRGAHGGEAARRRKST